MRQGTGQTRQLGILTLASLLSLIASVARAQEAGYEGFRATPADEVALDAAKQKFPAESSSSSGRNRLYSLRNSPMLAGVPRMRCARSGLNRMIMRAASPPGCLGSPRNR